MTPESQDKLEAFFKGFRPDSSPLLLLDYDGTLAPFRIDRFKARPWAGVRGQLARIQHQGSTRLVIVTGRPAAEIAPMFALDSPLEVWGLHGAERLYPDGRRELDTISAETRERLDALRTQLRRDSLGGLFEDKPNAAVMHWRGVAPRQAKLVEKKTRELFEPLAAMDGLRLQEFEAGLELRAGRDKGGAVDAILAEARCAAPRIFPAAYLGDDLTDEAAFHAIKGRGLSVFVRRAWRETAADIWLRPPAELRSFLDRWIQAVQA